MADAFINLGQNAKVDHVRMTCDRTADYSGINLGVDALVLSSEILEPDIVAIDLEGTGSRVMNSTLDTGEAAVAFRAARQMSMGNILQTGYVSEVALYRVDTNSDQATCRALDISDDESVDTFERVNGASLSDLPRIGVGALIGVDVQDANKVDGEHLEWDDTDERWKSIAP